ncbi:MAG: lysophospholipid acyltransferase family protein [Ignavibacteria bacterium]|nr:lysophospholipid acyltransferase family protein [Ignavibacteria bacterium]
MIRKFRFYLETFLVIIISFFSRWLSPKSRTLLGVLLGRLLKFSLKKRKKIAYENLRLAFPGKTKDWYKETVSKIFENIGITFAEFLSIPKLTDEDVKKYIRFKNVELIREVYKRNKGVILLSAHYGNWELLAFSVVVYLNIPVLIIVKPLSNYVLDKLVNKFRTLRGNSVVSMYDSARKVLRTIQTGGLVALLADQSATKDKDIFVDFFGRKAATFDSPAYFALKYKVPVIVGFAERKDNFYEVELVELDHSDLEYNAEGIYEFTKRYTTLLESIIRKRPELWLWTHRRWKHSPRN